MLPKFKQKRASEKLKTTDPEIYRLDFIDSPNNILYSFSLADQFGQKQCYFRFPNLVHENAITKSSTTCNFLQELWATQGKLFIFPSCWIILKSYDEVHLSYCTSPGPNYTISQILPRISYLEIKGQIKQEQYHMSEIRERHFQFFIPIPTKHLINRHQCPTTKRIQNLPGMQN